MSDDETVTRWAIRFTARARRNIQEAWEHLAENADDVVADAWQQGLEQEIAGLARFPYRHPVAPEKRLFGVPDVHRLLYRRTRTGPAYHVLFRIYGPAEAPSDAPFVRIVSVRHAAMMPLTEDEARLIEDDEDGT